jgi:uncharacterized protein (DUF362 family)
MTTSQVALIHGDDRCENINQALDLVGDRVDWASKQRLLIKPNLVSEVRLLANTHVEAVRVLLDWLRARYDGPIVIGEGSANGRTWAAFADFGYVDLADEYSSVELLDLNGDEHAAVRVFDSRMRSLTLRVSRTALESDCRISIGPPKTHESIMVTLALKNMIMGSLIRQLAPSASEAGSGSDRPTGAGIRSLLRSPLHSLLAGRGLYSSLPDWARSLRLVDHVKDVYLRRAIGSDKRQMHQGLPHLHLNLFALAPLLHPHLSIVDGWEGMEGSGPTWGDPVPWHVAIASSDFLAADALAAELMGFPIAEVGYLHYCQRMGLGAGTLEEMDIAGNVTVQEARRAFRPSPNQRLQNRWRLKHTERWLGEALALNSRSEGARAGT